MSYAPGIVDVFEQLALLEALILEDFDFASIHGKVMESLLLSPEKEEAFDLPHVDKRLLIMPATSVGAPPLVRSQDILCIWMPDSSSCKKQTPFMEAIIGNNSPPRPRTCFLSRHLQGEAKNAAKLLNSTLWIEWSIPYSAQNESSSLILNGDWHPESLSHVEKTIRKFVSTLELEHSWRMRISLSKNETKITDDAPTVPQFIN